MVMIIKMTTMRDGDSPTILKMMMDGDYQIMIKNGIHVHIISKLNHTGYSCNLRSEIIISFSVARDQLCSTNTRTKNRMVRCTRYGRNVSNPHHVRIEFSDKHMLCI